ncbi:MAG: class I SAM-dependent methyltransferase [Planctomycetia bacterium]|nr:class I SAM-dependent methyltransferase [Planctomycetia bacterium]
MLCPICESHDTKFVFEGYDHTYGYPKPAQMYQCRHCKHLFAGDTLSPEELTDMYTNYYKRGDLDVENYQPYRRKNWFLSWLDGESGGAYYHVPRNVRVLDIGCGYCETLGYHQNRGCEAYGCDADENTRKIAERHGFRVKIGLFNSDDYERNYFDYVTMDHVLEHLVDPVATIRDVAKVLKSPDSSDSGGGRLVMVSPSPCSLSRYCFGNAWSGWHLPFHRQFFTKKSLHLLAEKTGFVVEKMVSATQSAILCANWALFVTPHAPGKRRSNDAFLRGKNGDVIEEDQKRLDVLFYLFLLKSRVFALPMRLADALGVGDWDLMILRKK